MNERRTPLETLVRVRRLARDLRVRASKRSAAARALAEEDARRASDAASNESALLEDHGARGRPIARLRAAWAAVTTLHAGAARQRIRSREAAVLDDEARKALTEAESDLKGAERLEERRLAEERKTLARIEQRRLDDRSRSRAPGAGTPGLRKGALALAVGCFLFAADARAEGLGPTGSVEGLLSEIRTRMTELDRREAEIDERRRGIAELERAVEMRIRELDEVSLRVEKQIVDWEEAQGAKSISRLAKIYGAMPPHEAASLMESLDLDLATNVFAKMKPKKSAALLPLLSESRALSITRFVGHPLGISSARAASTP